MLVGWLRRGVASGPRRRRPDTRGGWSACARSGPLQDKKAGGRVRDTVSESTDDGMITLRGEGVAIRRTLLRPPGHDLLAVEVLEHITGDPDEVTLGFGLHRRRLSSSVTINCSGGSAK